MVFYNQPQTPDTSVVHEGKVCERDRGIDELSLNLDLVGDDILSLVIAVSSEDARLSEFTELQWCVSLESGQTAFICLADGFTSERAAVLGEVYRQDNSWRLCAVGQGREGGLAAIASGYGVTIATDEPESIHHHSTHRSW
jgi:stress response protein SCP2